MAALSQACPVRASCYDVTQRRRPCPPARSPGGHAWGERALGQASNPGSRIRAILGANFRGGSGSGRARGRVNEGARASARFLGLPTVTRLPTSRVEPLRTGKEAVTFVKLEGGRGARERLMRMHIA